MSTCKTMPERISALVDGRLRGREKLEVMEREQREKEELRDAYPALNVYADHYARSLRCDLNGR